MSDIWNVDSDGVSVGQLNGSDGWDCSTDSDEERPKKRTKRGSAHRSKRLMPTFNVSQQQSEQIELGQEDDDDDLLAACLTATTTPASRHKKPAGNGKLPSPSPLLGIDDDDVLLDGPVGTAAAVSTGAQRTSPDPVRLAALKQKELREQLAQAQHAGDEGDEDEVVLVDSDDDVPLPLPVATADEALEEDLLAELDPSLPGAAVRGAEAEEDKLPLVFQVQSHGSVTVRVPRGQPLKQAMDKFTQYAADNGWGRVTKFMFDGERMTGDDTPEDLDLDAEDVIDVYLEG